MELTYLVSDMNLLREDCNTIMKFRVSKKNEKLFDQLMTHSIPKQSAQCFGGLVMIRGNFSYKNHSLGTLALL